jgi:putative addiction module component (TIGR02574 family)
MSTFQDVLSAALTLNATDRLRLADTLWEDTPPADWTLPDAEWIAEAQRRSAEYDAGRMSAATWSDVCHGAR